MTCVLVRKLPNQLPTLIREQRTWGQRNSESVEKRQLFHVFLSAKRATTRDLSVTLFPAFAEVGEALVVCRKTGQTNTNNHPSLLERGGLTFFPMCLARLSLTT